MSESTAPSSAAGPALTPESSSENMVWRQFKKRKVGLFSLYIVLVLFAIAVYAPLLANHNPLALKTTHGTLYSYYYAGWNAVHSTITEGVRDNAALLKERSAAEAAYEDHRQNLRTLMEKYNAAGNSYDSSRTAVNRIQDELDQIAEELKELKDSGSPKIQALEARRTELEEKKKPLEAQVKESGAEKAALKRQVDERRSDQDQQNQVILKTNFRLNYSQHATAILKNLTQMKFPVNAETRDKLAAIIERYDAAFEKLAPGKPVEPAMVEVLDTLRKDVETTLSPEQVQSKLEYRWTFPALAALDWTDRAFMVGYALFLILFILGRRVSGTIPQKVAGIVVASLLTSGLCSALSADIPNRNYKVLFLDNLKAGASDSFALMSPIYYGFTETRVEEKLQRPMFAKDPSGRVGLHVLGTDDYGRDVLSRMVWGARVSLSVGFVAVTIYVLLGVIMGSIAGFFGGWVDIVISRFIEIVICFPSFFLILAVIAFIGPSIYNVMIVIGLTSWTGIARLTRGEFLRLRNLEFVLAAEAAGISKAAIIFRHVLPNAMTPVMVSAAFGFAGSILTESGLSYLGFGVQEPFPSWGQMLSDSQGNPLLYWWLFVVPGIALFLTVTIYNLAGNAFRDAADPRLRQ